MNQFKYEPSGRDVKVTLSGEIFIDSNPRIQALITLLNSMDPEFLSRTTYGRIVVELQDALHDALDKYRDEIKTEIESRGIILDR